MRKATLKDVFTEEEISEIVCAKIFKETKVEDILLIKFGELTTKDYFSICNCIEQQPHKLLLNLELKFSNYVTNKYTIELL